MSTPEEMDEGAPASNTAIIDNPPERMQQDRAESAVPSSMSIKSDWSMAQPIVFSSSERKSEGSHVPSGMSIKSDWSMAQPIVFSRTEQKSEDSHVPSSMSIKSDWSMAQPIVFNPQDSVLKVQQETSGISSGSKTDLRSIFKLLEENIVAYVKNELKTFERVLGQDYQFENEETTDGEDEEQCLNKEAFLKLTLQFMRRMNQGELAIALQKRTLAPICCNKLKSNLKEKFQHVFEGTLKPHPTLLTQIYTELHITEGEMGEVNNEHEVMQLETASRKQDRIETTIQLEHLFRASPGANKPSRTLMTKGVAGIGKTVLVQKYTLDWVEGKAGQDIQFTFPFTFRELNLLKGKNFSLVELVEHFFPETKETGICRFKEFQVLFIFDGLDECRLPLDFQKNEILTDVKVSSSIDVLLTSLIQGKLLPSAHIWITTRPAAASQISPEYVDMVTEVRGFTDSQKEEYFRKRFRDGEQASRIISHIKASRGLHIMCHIPIFCWITAQVFEDVLETREGRNLPKTFTELYIDFVVVQSKLKNIKYDGGTVADHHWTPESRKMIVSLGKLAFEQLNKGNLIFYESDLSECGIDIREASVYSGLFTQVFKEERALYVDKVFCFVHLSVQEFLAALYVHLTFFGSGVDQLMDVQTASLWSRWFSKSPELFYQNAVDKATESPNGRLDLFLRFLVGLSLQTNQSHLQGLLTQKGNSSQTNQRTAQYIKKKLCEKLSPERSINLFHCLNELKDSSLEEEIQMSLSSGSLCTDELSPAQWSALQFILMSSEKDLDVFDLKKYSATEETLLRLLPVVKASTAALLSGCDLSKGSCDALSSVLSSPSCNLRELDLSNNDLKDSGVKLLCAGLTSPHCKLEVLRLSGCLITKEGCTILASALRSCHTNLKELDLSYNNPGNSGVKLLSSALQSPDALRASNMGLQSMTPGLRKYACKLFPDLNTVNKKLGLSDNNSKVTVMKEKQPYPEHPERFSYWKQLLCNNGLTGRCYWEVEWTGHVYIAVAYKGIKKKGEGQDSCLGGNNQSWSLSCSDEGYSVLDNEVKAQIHVPTSNRVGVYLDWPAGTLSFWKISSDKKTHLYTINTTFTEPVYPAFRVKVEPVNSSVTLNTI